MKPIKMNTISKEQLLQLAKCTLAITTIFLTACGDIKEVDIGEICGNWVSTTGKPDVLIFKEGDIFKLTLFRKKSVTRKIKPETFLIVQENDNLFINTGFRIDIAYNEVTDVLTFSPNGDYTRASEK